MMKYVHIQDQTILSGPEELPDVFVSNDGSQTVLAGLADEDLALLNWYPWVEIHDEFDPMTQYRSHPPTIVFEPTRVTATYDIAFLSLEECKLNKCSAINTIRDNIFNNGYSFNGMTFDCDDSARSNLMGAAIAAMVNNMSLPPSFPGWRSKDNTIVPMTAQQIIGLGMSIMMFYTTVMAVSWYHKDNINALTTEEAVSAYNINVGWPG